MTETVQSADGTSIAFERSGQGPTVILVGGALNDRRARAAGLPLAQQLAPRCTVIAYDRRGCGDSRAAPPYTIDQEIEDLAALIRVAGGRAALYGLSSGGWLAVAAAVRGLAVDKLAVYEAPLVAPAPSVAEALDACVAEGRSGDAVELFMTQVVQMPAAMVAGMRSAPFWPALAALAPTLGHNVRITGEGQALVERARGLRVPTLVLAGSSSPPWMRDGARALADAAQGRYGELASQTHDVDPVVLASALGEFFAA